jgi:hypothetical protein
MPTRLHHTPPPSPTRPVPSRSCLRTAARELPDNARWPAIDPPTSLPPPEPPPLDEDCSTKFLDCPPGSLIDALRRTTSPTIVPVNLHTDQALTLMIVDIGLVESPFQHTCLKHLQDCVVNGD